MTAAHPDGFTVLVDILVHAGHRDRLLQAITKFLPHTVADGGLRLFQVHLDEHDDDHVVLYEQWEDQGSFDASLKSAWREDYEAATSPLWREPRRIRILHDLPLRWPTTL